MFAADVAVSVGGLILGLLLAVLIYVVGELLARRMGERLIVVVAAALALIVVILLGFDFTGDLD